MGIEVLFSKETFQGLREIKKENPRVLPEEEIEGRKSLRRKRECVCSGEGE